MKKEKGAKPQDDEEWGGLDLDKGKAGKPNGSRLLGRKAKKDDSDDDLDGLLGNIEEARGMSQEPEPKKEEIKIQERPKTGIPKRGSGMSLNNNNDYGLEDKADPRVSDGKLSGRGEVDLASKRKALFGGGLSDSAKKEKEGNLKRDPPAQRAKTAVPKQE